LAQPSVRRWYFSFVVRVDRHGGSSERYPLTVGRYRPAATGRRPELVEPDRVLSGEFHPVPLPVAEAALVVRDFVAAIARQGVAVVEEVRASTDPGAGMPAPDPTVAADLARLLGLNKVSDG
jgi:hypothetical protein